MRNFAFDLPGSATSTTSLAEQLFQKLLEEAEDARQYGVSWRDYRVGVSALLRNYNHALGCYQYYLDSDANNKPLEEGGHRVCGEEYLLARAKKQGSELLWLVIAAPPQKDDHAPPELFLDETHTHHLTLKSCGYCRTMYNDALLRLHTRRHLHRAITRHTWITSVNVETGYKHTYKVGWLLRHYGVPDKRWKVQTFS